MSDTGKAVSQQYGAEREPGDKYYDYGIPRRISYLIDPEGRIHKVYDVETQEDFAAHSAEVLADIRAAG